MAALKPSSGFVSGYKLNWWTRHTTATLPLSVDYLLFHPASLSEESYKKTNKKTTQVAQPVALLTRADAFSSHWNTAVNWPSRAARAINEH